MNIKVRKILDIFIATVVVLAVILVIFYHERQKRIEYLFNAMSEGDVEAAKTLLTKDSSLANAKSHKCKEYGWSPYNWSPIFYLSIKKDVNKNQVEIVKLLIAKGANVKSKDEYAKTALHYVNSKDIALLLLAHGADVNACDGEGLTPLHQAVKENRVKIAELLILKGADVNARDKALWSPLHYVRSKDAAKLLLSKGADINARTDGGLTPLHTVFRWQRDKSQERALIELVEFLISKGADVNARADSGETPLKECLGWAKSNNLGTETTVEIEDLLRKHGAKE